MAKPLYLHASHLEKRKASAQSITSTKNKKACAVSDILNDTDDIGQQMSTKSWTIPLQSGGGPHVISETWQNEPLVTPGNTEIDIHKLANESDERVEINGTLYTLKEMIDLISIFGKPELDQMGTSFWFDVEKTILVKHWQRWYGQSAMGRTAFEAITSFFRIVSSGNEVKAGTWPAYTWDNSRKIFKIVHTRVLRAHDILDTL